jgi:hypothetical protein
MLASQRTLASAQLNRDTLKEIVEAPNKPREIALESFRRRNAVLDAFFYDVCIISPPEAQSVSPWLAREGSLLIVPPSGAGGLLKCEDIEAFAKAYEVRPIRILTVAGVGSSALGSAAYARNVANAFQEPVAAIVSGYGLSDLMTEALGGWFLFGALNRMRHQFEILDDLSHRRASAGTEAISAERPLRLGDLSLDTMVAMALLSDPRFKFEILTGHSKGNLVLSEALYELEKPGLSNRGPTNTEPMIVTLSAAVAMPSRYKKVIDVIGRLDGFGAMNSIRPVEKVWPKAWHHTNTEAWFHLPVTAVFRDLIAQGRV